MWRCSRFIWKLQKQKLFYEELRYFMSNSFECNDVWANRLKAPIIQKVSTEDFYYELENKYSQSNRLSGIDLDIFVNAIKDGEHLDEMEDLVHKFRLSRDAANILESTPHAFIRNYLNYGDTHELMRILNDRVNYGIFPDKYCCLLMMNYFIKQGDFCDAAKVATLQMLQEDFYDDLFKYLSLYSCHKYLLNPTEWEKPEEKDESEDGKDEEEEVKVRVKYIRNPFFDNHFDLKEPDHLIGKTLLMISESMKEPFIANYKLLGLILFDDKNTDYLTDLLKSKDNSFDVKTLELAEKVIEQKLKKLKNSEGGSVEVLESIKQVVKNLKEKSNAELDLLCTIEETIKSLVDSTEKTLIEEQVQLYEAWEDKRDETLKHELEELNKKLILDQIQQKKDEMKKKEDELFFFEKEDELDLRIESKRVPDPQKWIGKKKKSTEEDYVPPEITKQRS